MNKTCKNCRYWKPACIFYLCDNDCKYKCKYKYDAKLCGAKWGWCEMAETDESGPVHKDTLMFADDGVLSEPCGI